MYRKMSFIILGIALILFTTSAQAAVSFSFDLDEGTPANGGLSWHPYAEFNINFSENFQGVTSTFGYCAEYASTIDYKKYQFSDRDISNVGEYRAAWLMEKYAFASGNYEGYDGSVINNRDAITALQASIWTLMGTTNQLTPITKPDGIEALYDEMMNAANTKSLADLKSLGLDLKYQILMPNIQLPEGTEGDFQNLIVRTNAVPIPGAAMLLAPVLLGLVSFRRKFAA